MTLLWNLLCSIHSQSLPFFSLILSCLKMPCYLPLCFLGGGVIFLLCCILYYVKSSMVLLDCGVGAKEILQELSEKQGKKMNSVDSAKDIPKFINFFQAC